MFSSMRIGRLATLVCDSSRAATLTVSPTHVYVAPGAPVPFVVKGPHRLAMQRGSCDSLVAKHSPVDVDGRHPLVAETILPGSVRPPVLRPAARAREGWLRRVTARGLEERVSLPARARPRCPAVPSAPGLTASQPVSVHAHAERGARTRPSRGAMFYWVTTTSANSVTVVVVWATSSS